MWPMYSSKWAILPGPVFGSWNDPKTTVPPTLLGNTLQTLQGIVFKTLVRIRYNLCWKMTLLFVKLSFQKLSHWNKGRFVLCLMCSCLFCIHISCIFFVKLVHSAMFYFYNDFLIVKIQLVVWSKNLIYKIFL